MKHITTHIAPWLHEALTTYGRERRPFFALLSYDGQEAYLWPLEELPLDVQVHFPSFQTVGAMKTGSVPQLEVSLPPYASYHKTFMQLQYHLHRGDTYLTNLTVASDILSPTPLEEYFWASRAKYRVYIPQVCTFFSPETFVRISQEGIIRTYPMKGTISAEIPDAQRLLSESLKEQQEHATVVDLLRNDLSRIAQDVTVPRFRYIERVEKQDGALLQMSSEIEGTLSTDWHSHLGDIMDALLPAGSITGAPKSTVQEIIAMIEAVPRGFYTGVSLLYDGESLDSCVNIRYIEQFEEGLRYRSGGGVTALSDCAMEYQELQEKIYVPLS